MENRFWDLVSQLGDGEYQTAVSLGKRLGCSEKTVRNLIKDVNSALQDSGAVIESKQRYGYHLVISDEERWLQFQQEQQEKPDQLPATVDERMYFLLHYLLSAPDFVKLSDLGEQLYVSAQTLSAVLKRVEELLTPYHITIERKPYYGIRASGMEFDKRCCLIRYFSAGQELFCRTFHANEDELQAIAKILTDTLPQYQITLTEISLQNLIHYLFVSKVRLQSGFSIDRPRDNLEELHLRREFRAAADVCRQLGGSFETQAEIYYTSVYIAAKRHLNDQFGINFVISEGIDYIVMEMLRVIYHTFKINLMNNLNLRMMLNQHLAPLDIRLRYGVPVENPVLYDIKKDYFFAYTVADRAAVVLRQSYHCEIPESEIGWLALIFQMAIENKGPDRKLNVLLVCASGQASSHLLLAQIRKNFGEYISNADICTNYELKSRSLTNVDYIFTTVPITDSVNVPILEVHDFIKHYEVAHIRNVFQKHNRQFLDNFYDPQLFFTGISGASREEVIFNICEKIRDVTDLPAGFYDSILRREYLGATDYGNLVAIPHPERVMTPKNVVCVSVLDHPIKWAVNPVQVVFLVSLSLEDQGDTTNFYKVTSQFISSEDAVSALLAKSSYENLIDLLYQIETDDV